MTVWMETWHDHINIIMDNYYDNREKSRDRAMPRLCRIWRCIYIRPIWSMITWSWGNYGDLYYTGRYTPSIISTSSIRNISISDADCHDSLSHPMRHKALHYRRGGCAQAAAALCSVQWLQPRAKWTMVTAWPSTVSYRTNKCTHDCWLYQV